MIKLILPVYALTLVDINRVIKDLPNEMGKPVFVVNGVDDDVLAHIEHLHKSLKIEAVYLDHQVGKTEAMRRGLEKALQDEEAEIFVQIDGRGKRPITVVPALVDYLRNKKADMVIANRYKSQDMSNQQHRTAIASFTSSIVMKMTGYSLQDAVCGMRAYSREMAILFCNVRGYGYGVEIEELIISSLHDKRVIEYPVSSNLQANGTNAEKLEDNFLAFLIYANVLKMTNPIKEQMCYALTMLKKRRSFSISDGSTIFEFNYLRGEEEIIDAYSSQKLSDAYEVSIKGNIRVLKQSLSSQPSEPSQERDRVKVSH